MSTTFIFCLSSAYLLKDAVTINNKRAEHVKRYCTCGQGEFGRMVGCDNENCSIGWFHFSCVGLDENLPVDSNLKWFCDACIRYSNSKKRKIETDQKDGAFLN